ncbi:alpha/beta fold hydrolase [Actinokineospora sp. UTMC 2448]|uniref:alpha/beta fold hydrolase n=1 Tax=Actinokineospora sp. UTMC 2448 TaxID=2268449 RepID=UPI002164EE2F|nr:alpha/beta hydrolase [Actinokineospora sp. UTMC 2448]UVS77001.1 Lipase 3 precursor [Actinokineospora sp. UTMC 2448]
MTKIEVSYERRGGGEPLVLLHGIGHRWQAWEPVMDRLAERHDVIALDLFGFGASPMLPEGRAYTVPGAVAALAEVFDDLGVTRPHIAGNSLGGMLALELAARDLVRSATVLSPAGFWTARDRAWAIRVLSGIRLTARLKPSLQRVLFASKLARFAGGSLLFGRPSWLTAEVMLADMAAMAAAPGFDAVIAAGGRDYFYLSPAPEVPVTVAWGTRDRILWPRQARRCAEILPDARHVSLPGCGHVPMGDDPDRVADLIMATCREAALTP